MQISGSFTVATFSNDGELESSEQVLVEELASESVHAFTQDFLRLSGDLELPLEGKLPGDLVASRYRICSDLNGAYVLYYVGDDVVFASLLLSGTDETSETELTQVFKFLLLDTGDVDDPTDEEIDAVLDLPEFDFFGFEDRPLAIEILFSNHPEDARVCQQIVKLDRCLAAAFFSSGR